MFVAWKGGVLVFLWLLFGFHFGMCLSLVFLPVQISCHCPLCDCESLNLYPPIYCLFVGLVIKNKIFPIITSGTTILLTPDCPTTNSKVDLLAPCLYTLTFVLGHYPCPPPPPPPISLAGQAAQTLSHKNILTSFLRP